MSAPPAKPSKRRKTKVREHERKLGERKPWEPKKLSIAELFRGKGRDRE